MKKSSTETIIASMRILARDIYDRSGLTNAAIAEAADRLEELQAALRQIVDHQNMMGGGLAKHSTTKLIAERALKNG